MSSTEGSLVDTSTCGDLHNSSFLDSPFRYRLFSVSYSIMFVLGLVGNTYALFVLYHMRKAKAMNEVRIYMTNLTVADLLFVCILPFWIGYYSNCGNWTYSEALCRIAGSFYYINTYCSVLFLAVISINRYWAVTRPLVAASSDCWRRGAIVSCLVWVFPLGVAIHSLTKPGIQTDNVTQTNRCLEGYQQENYDKKVGVAVTHFIIISLFFVVFLLVVVCNVLIARALLLQPISRPRASTGRRPDGTKRRAVRMLSAVVGVFVVCFVPHHVVQGPWTLAVLKLNNWTEETRQRLNDAHQIVLLLMGLNCILDPVVYCFATRKFRKYIQDHMRRLKKGKNCSTNTTTTGLSMKAKHHSEQLSVFDDRNMSQRQR